MKIVLSIITFSLGFSLISQQNNLIKPTTKIKIDSIYNELITTNKVVGTSIAIVDNGEIVYSMGYGFSEQEKNIEATDKSIYRIGSCTKSFTALSIMKLVEEGKIDLDESFMKYFPELNMEKRSYENKLTIREMLSHTSGLMSDISNGFFCDSPPDINWVINQLNQYTYTTPGNYIHSYSNIAYGLLGELIARKSNSTYHDYLKDNLFSSLNMDSSYVLGKTPIGYLGEKRIIEPAIRDQAAGLINSNVVDMGNYLIFLLQNGSFNGQQLVNDKSIAEMEKNQIENVTLPEDEANWGFGLYSSPLKIMSENDTIICKTIGHAGDTRAFHSDFQYIPEKGVGAVILTNTDKGSRVRSASRLLRYYLKYEKGESIKWEKGQTKHINYTVPTNEDLKGFYAVGSFNIEIKDAKKIKTKIGKTKLILKQIGDSAKYEAKVKVLGLIPFKIKHQAYRFVKIGDDILFKVINTYNGNESFDGIKTEIQPITESWRSKLGTYEAINIFPCKSLKSQDFESISITLKEKNNKLYGVVEANSKKEISTYFVLINDSLAITPGITRGSGKSLSISNNGNLMFDGYELQRK